MREKKKIKQGKGVRTDKYALLDQKVTFLLKFLVVCKQGSI